MSSVTGGSGQGSRPWRSGKALLTLCRIVSNNSSGYWSTISLSIKRPNILGSGFEPHMTPEFYTWAPLISRDMPPPRSLVTAPLRDRSHKCQTNLIPPTAQLNAFTLPVSMWSCLTSSVPFSHTKELPYHSPSLDILSSRKITWGFLSRAMCLVKCCLISSA